MITAMARLPYTLYRACDTRELDRITIEEFSIPGIELMNRAGAAVFDEICGRWPEARRIVVVCGGGNNGGDGYVVARLAREKGFQVELFALVEPHELKGDAAKAWRAFESAGMSVSEFSSARLQQADVIVDAIFGTGLDREVEGRWAEAIAAINGSGVPVVAVDIPSGIHADSGCVLGVAVQAEATVSFIGLNRGLFTAQAVDYCGVIQFDDLGVRPEVYQQVPPSAERIDWPSIGQELRPRAASSHKGDFGHTLLIGGNLGMAGAIRLAGEATARTGSGLTSVATLLDHVVAMAAARPEVMWHGVQDKSELEPLLAKATVLAIGPGLGQDYWANEMLATVLASELPAVVDADALNLLPGLAPERDNWIITPHPGEAARLLECSTADVLQDRFAAALQLAQRYNAITVLKGAGSLVATPDGQLSLCTDGNPGMASGGMGDVLTGIIAGLVAQRLTLRQAARLGVALHAYVADKLAINGSRGYLAGDVVNALRSALH